MPATKKKGGASTALRVTNKDLGSMLAANQQALENALSGAPLVLAEFAVALDNAVAQNETLANCVKDNPESVRNAVLTCAMLGLRPGPAHKHFALVPYRVQGKLTCVGIPEWRGYVEIANQAGKLDSAIVCDVVYDFEVKPAKRGDPPTFAYDRMTGEIKHEQDLLGEHDDKRNPENMVAVYATCKVRGRTGYASVVLTKRDVERRRATSAAWKSKGKDSVWGTDPPAMWRKSAMRALLDSGKVPMTRDRLSQIATAEQEATDVEEEVLKEAVVTVADEDAAPAAAEPGGNAEEHREDLLFRFEACVSARSEGDQEKAAKLRADIVDSTGVDPEIMETPELERLVKQMEARTAAAGAGAKSKGKGRGK